ncbi:MAG: hypothetical protein D6757_06355 [Alphaproteobacteria bacterium]|nr:MAG: hypothetical protein D6757_06355 [Alphaproteobacteria bacterium]
MAESRQADRRALLGGAGLAFLGRLGALVEAASLPIFLALYGPVLFGLYATLWAAARLLSAGTQMGMVLALQRFVPALEDDEAAVHRVVGIAFVTVLFAGVLAALAVVAAAPEIAARLDREGALGSDAIGIVRLYAWILPGWSMVEVLTASVRARRRFGPEIRVRVFYEQAARLVLATGLAFAGVHRYGLFVAHLASVLFAALLAWRLTVRFYDRRRLLAIGGDPVLIRRVIGYALPLVPSELIVRAFSELPVVLLNQLLPGAQAAAAAGFYAIARKIASVLQLVYNAFDYVLSPLAAWRHGKADMRAVADMYRYSTRLMLVIGAIVAAGLAAASDLLVALLGHEAGPVAPTLMLLLAGRYASFLFGQAQAVVRTTMPSWLVLLNGLAGLAVMLAGVLLLAPARGPVGAAIGAAAGLIVMHALAALELAVRYRLVAFSRELFRPLAVAWAAAAGLLAIDRAMAGWPASAQLLLLILLLVLSFALVLRYGLHDEDAEAFGSLARRLRGRRGSAGQGKP